MKKVISIILSLVMLFSLLPVQTFAAEQYTDTAGNWAEGAIDRWSEYGVIEGSNGRFDPNGTLTRAQMAAILSRLLALPEAKSAGFSDVAQTDWFAPYINSCYAAGIMQGSDGKAQPNDPITREQAIVMLSRALGIKPIENADLSGYTDAATVSDWAKGYVAAMAEAGIVKGTSATTVSPKASIDRAATVTILDRAIGTYANVDGAEVTAADSGIILIAADNVKVTGAAKNATVVVSPSADGTTVNGAAVAAGTTTAAAEEKQDKPAVSGGGGGGPTPSYSNLTISEDQKVADGVYALTGGTYKNVTIPASVGNGDVTLDNVTITGELIVQGGGENSIHLDGCKVDTIQVNKDTTVDGAQQPRIELNNTPVQTIEAVKPVIIEADQKSTVKAVEAKSDVTVQGENTTVQNVTAAADNVKLTVEGAAVEKVTAEKPVTIEATSEASTIKEVEAQSDVTVQGAATEVKKVTVPESAASTGVELKIEGAKVAEVAAEKPVTIEATAGASPIESVTAKDNVTVDGAQIETVTVPKDVNTKPEITVTTGTVSTIEAKSEVKVEGGNNTVANVKAEAPVEVASAAVTTITVTVQVSVTVTVTGNQPVDVAVETTSAVSVVTTNTNVSVSTTLNEEINVVTKEKESSEGTKVTHVHKWVEDTAQYVAATCTQTGKRVYVCGGVGECDVTERTKNETLPMLPHTEQIVPAKAATCTETGLTAGKKCSVCDTVLVAQQNVPAFDHAYATVWSSDSANHWHACTRKGCTAINSEANHIPGAAATETTDQTCTICGYVIAPSLGHQCKNHLTKTSARAATCTAAGNSEYYTCACGKFYSNANATTEIAKDSWIIPATGHSYGTPDYEWKAVSGGYTCTATRVCSYNENHKETETVIAIYAVTENPTCQKEGTATYTAAFTSPFTQQTMDDVKIAKLLHKEVKVDGTPATCEGTGLTDGVKCSVCDTVLVEQEVIPELGHDYSVAQHDDSQHWMKCSRCESTTEKTDHSFDAHSCTETAKCKGCEYVKPAGQHSYGAYTQTEAPTCTEKGSEHAFCSVCQHEDVREVAALGHSWATEWSNDATQHWHECQREGCGARNEVANHTPGAEATETTAQTCTVCGREIAPALGHICKNHLTEHAAVSATCTTAGNSAYWSCECGKFYSDADAEYEISADSWVIHALGHSLVGTNAKDATCTEAGNNAYWTCSMCHKVYSDANGTTETTVEAQTLAALNHDLVHHDAKAATCTEIGWDAYDTCSRCDYTTYAEIPALGHSYGDWIAEDSSSGTTAGTKGHYHCSVCGKDFDAQHQELDDLTIPASYVNVSTVDELAAAMTNNALLGAELAENIEIPGDGTLPEGKTLIIPEGKTLTVTGKLYVYGTLDNKGTINNRVLIDVFGGATLTNSGTITGVKEKETDEVYASSLGIEGGATLTNTGTINDCVSVADYYFADGGIKAPCNVRGEGTIAAGNLVKMVVAFGTNQITPCLALEDYKMVVPCGTENGANTIDLSDITVPTGKTLLLKNSVFDGTNTYQNSFTVSSGTLTVSAGAYLICKDSTVTVAAGATLNAYSYTRFATLNVSGHVYTEEGGMDVETALTVNQGGELEIGSGSGLNYTGTSDAVINGKLIKTVRYGNGFDNILKQSEFSENIKNKVNATLTTLVITDGVTLSGNNTVDVIIPYAGTLRVAPGGSLKYKQILTEAEGETLSGTVVGSKSEEPDANGYKTLTSDFTSVGTFDDFEAALENNTVTGIYVNADITVPAQYKWAQLEIAKPVVVAAGKTLTVAGYTTDGDKFGFLANDLAIVEGGSLTLEAGATLKTTAIESGENEPFYNYTGRVCVAGGTLDVSKGTVAGGSFFNYDYGDDCTDSNALVLGSNAPEIEFAVHNEAQLCAAIADDKCTGGVIVENDITLEGDLTVTKLVLVNDEKTLTVPAGENLTVADGGKLQVSGTLFVYGTLDNAGEIFNLNLIDVFGSGTLTNSGEINGNWCPDENGKFSYVSSLGIEGGATLTNTGTINDCIAVADYFGYGANKETKTCMVTGIDAIDPDNVDKMAVVFDAAQIQTLLNNNSYEIVMPCGTNATQDNTIDLGGITVPAGKILLLKKSVFDGTNTYQNSFVVSEGATFTQTQGALVVLKGDPTLAVGGTVAFAAQDEDGLAQALENPSVTKITCSDNLALTRELEIPEGKSVTVNGSLTAAQNCGIVVQSGGSLTVTGSLTLATSSTDYFMEDAGSIEVQKGGSLSIGGVQYIGSGGALTLDSDNASLVLSGIPQDCASQDHPNGIFVLLTGNATVEDNKEFVVTDAWDNFILTNDASLTVNGTLTNSGHMENRGTLNVYGTLNNEGEIFNLNLIDVIGGTLSNSGVINGNWNEDWYDSYIAIEDGATINNFISSDGGEVNDRVTVADYWKTESGPVKQCHWNVLENDHTFDPVFANGKDNPNFDVMALAFGTEQVKAALDAVSTWSDGTEQHSAPTYESVLPCGTMAWDGTDETVNTVELGDITVHEFGALMLKDEVFDGTNVYRNKYKISEGKKLTLQGGAALVGVSKDENNKVGLEINGEIVNNGGFVDFNQFNLSGTKVVQNADELATALANGGTIILLPFAEDDENRHEDNWEEIGTVYESRYHISNSGDNYLINKNTELIGLGTGNEIVTVFFDGGFTVDSGVTLKINGLNIVAVENSVVDGTVKVYNNAQLIVQGKEGTTLTINGKVFVGEGEATALAIYAEEGVNNKIVNNGIIENFGDLIFERDSEKGQFEGNEPIEYASLRDLVCELCDRFGENPNMESLNLPNNPNEGPVEDLRWVYAYPDGGNRFFNDGNDPDFDAIAAFSWFIKNDIIPQYNKDTNPELRPFDLVTNARAAELLNKLGNKLAKTTGQTYSTLSGNDLLSRGELKPAVDALELAVRKAGGENIVQNAAELAEALENGDKIYLLPVGDYKDEAGQAQYHLTGAYTIGTDTELIKLGDEKEMVAVFFDGGFTVGSDDSDVTLKIDGLDIVAAADSEVSGKIEVRNGQVVVQGANNVGATMLINNGEIFVDGSGALAIYQDGNKIVNNGTIDVLGELIAPMGHNWDDKGENDQRIYVVENEGSCINFFPDVMEFGKRLSERVEAYGLPEMEEEEREENREGAEEWPSGDDRIGGFEFLVKNGGVEPVSEGNRDVWKPYDKIRYGEAIGILTNVYKAIAGQDEQLPDTVALGDEDWPKPEDCISDRDVDELLDKFVAALPQINDSTTESFTVVKDQEQVISNKAFSKLITITCAAPDGGDIEFDNCAFNGGVTVKMTGGVGYNVRLNDNCTGSFTVTAEDDVIGRENTGVNFFGMNGVTINGLSISGEGMANVEDNDFNVNVRYDEDGESGDGKKYILTVEIYNSTDKTVTVETDDEATYTGKLRVAGKLDISGVTLGANSRIELSDQCNSEIALGSNDIVVNDDCGGSYTFAGTGTVTVPNQNENARITVNGKFLGSPHVFGDGDGIYLGLTDTDGVSFKLEQGDEELNFNAVLYNESGPVSEQNPTPTPTKLQLEKKDDNNWIGDPNNVCLTVTVNGLSVVYDPLRNKVENDNEDQ